jgi:hypothetical protein
MTKYYNETGTLTATMNFLCILAYRPFITNFRVYYLFIIARQNIAHLRARTFLIRSILQAPSHCAEDR